MTVFRRTIALCDRCGTEVKENDLAGKFLDAFGTPIGDVCTTCLIDMLPLLDHNRQKIKV